MEFAYSQMREKGNAAQRSVVMGNPTVSQVGGGQAIYLDRDQDVFLGASDRRKDGCAIGY